MDGPILNLNSAPKDPIERLVWLGGVNDQVQRELDEQFSEAYFWSRFTGRLDTALGLRLHSRKKVMAYTRHHNNDIGRQVRWNDGRT